MAAALITINNISVQNVPILVNSISLAAANSVSEIPPSTAAQISIPAGQQIIVENQRVDIGQLDQLRKKKLITYTI